MYQSILFFSSDCMATFHQVHYKGLFSLSPVPSLTDLEGVCFNGQSNLNDQDNSGGSL